MTFFHVKYRINEEEKKIIVFNTLARKYKDKEQICLRDLRKYIRDCEAVRYFYLSKTKYVKL
jgi:hypothetical protein